MKLRKLVSLGLATSMLASLALTGCGSEEGGGDSEAKGKVYYLNFKPEADAAWKKLAEEYTKQTGVEVTVVTAANNQYESTLAAEISGSAAPTLFQINGPVGYDTWSDYCYDLSGTKLYDMLADKSLAIKDGDGVYGIPYAVEGYGIIYNNAIMEKYFALDGAKARSMDEINNFDKLKEVVEDMQARKAELQIDGVFASTSLKAGEDWRYQTHLANLPVYYEYEDNDTTCMTEIEFTYADNYKNILDLYLNNSCTEPGLVGTKTVNDAMAEFALGQVAMVQNGNWGWGQISGTEGNKVKAEDVKFLPIYTDVAGEEGQGLCVGTENYFCVNKEASQADIDATIAFVEWVFSSDVGKKAVKEELGFITPFNTFTEAESPEDPLAKEIVRYLGNESLTSVAWVFTTFPSQQFKDDFGAALLAYAQGQKEWSEVEELVVSKWASEWANNQ